MNCQHCGEKTRCDLNYRTTYGSGLAYFHIRPWLMTTADHLPEPVNEVTI